jgi:hypothetical protein
MNASAPMPSFPTEKHAKKHPRDGEAFNRALAELRGNGHQQIADAYESNGVNAVADVVSSSI